MKNISTNRLAQAIIIFYHTLYGTSNWNRRKCPLTLRSLSRQSVIPNSTLEKVNIHRDVNTWEQSCSMAWKIVSCHSSMLQVLSGHESFTCEVSPQAQGSVDFSSSPLWQQDCSSEIFILFKNTDSRRKMENHFNVCFELCMVWFSVKYLNVLYQSSIMNGNILHKKSPEFELFMLYQKYETIKYSLLSLWGKEYVTICTYVGFCYEWTAYLWGSTRGRKIAMRYCGVWNINNWGVLYQIWFISESTEKIIT